MIPKIIHYCWFGGNPLPELAQKCIASWKRYLPDYEIKEWNESNFDLECCSYVEEAYEAKKWAFVSDYARFWILYHEGGLYFDTDVEIINSLDEIIEKGPFIGCEDTQTKYGKSLGTNPGLGLAAGPGLNLYKEVLDYYGGLHFLWEHGAIETVVDHTTALFERHGWQGDGYYIEKVEGIYVYPPEYFCPYSYRTGKWNITSNTVSIHHYAASWHTPLDEFVIRIERCDATKHSVMYRIRRCASFPFRVINKIQKMGWKETMKFILQKKAKDALWNR
jgi:hypothetical protein